MLVCASCHNHSTLIANVYPANPGEDGPNPSALSLLVFYASSKPQKLPKIGSFLEASVEKDLQRLRYGHVKCSLSILSAILTECKRHASLISKSVLRIILMVLNSSDLNLTARATDLVVGI